MKDQYDQIAEVDTIVEKSEDVEKFNPWHDARGRFTTAGGGGGRGSFSANPKTKSGQMAIARAYQSGHQTAFNRHKESKGENVHQNYKWINSTGRKGSFPGTRQQPGYTGTTSRRGLNARTRTLTSTKPTNHLPNSMRPGNTTSTASKPKTTSKPAPIKPKTTTTSKPKTTQSKPASSKPAAGAKKPSTSHKVVNGKDLSKTIDTTGLDRQKAMNYVARKQGYKGQGRVIKSRTEFEDAVKQSGIVMYRTLGDGTDVISKKPTSASKFIDYMKTGTASQLSLNGSGASAYGQGIYTASASTRPGKKPSAKKQMAAAEASIDYQRRGAGKTVAMTLDPSAKIGKYDTLHNELMNLSRGERRKYQNDVGVYAAAKGYDAVTANTWDGDYTMVYNRTKMIFFDTTYDNLLPSDLGFHDTRMPVGAF